MSKNRIIKLSPDGMITSLYSDFLAPLGKAEIHRASNVEYSDLIGKWTVELLVGPFANATLMKTFDKRSDELFNAVGF